MHRLTNRNSRGRQQSRHPANGNAAPRSPEKPLIPGKIPAVHYPGNGSSAATDGSGDRRTPRPLRARGGSGNSVQPPHKECGRAARGRFRPAPPTQTLGILAAQNIRPAPDKRGNAPQSPRPFQEEGAVQHMDDEFGVPVAAFGVGAAGCPLLRRCVGRDVECGLVACGADAACREPARSCPARAVAGQIDGIRARKAEEPPVGMHIPEIDDIAPVCRPEVDSPAPLMQIDIEIKRRVPAPRLGIEAGDVVKAQNKARIVQPGEHVVEIAKNPLVPPDARVARPDGDGAGGRFPRRIGRRGDGVEGFAQNFRRKKAGAPGGGAVLSESQTRPPQQSAAIILPPRRAVEHGGKAGPEMPDNVVRVLCIHSVHLFCGKTG